MIESSDKTLSNFTNKAVIRVSIQTLGCRSNQYESARIEDRLGNAGYQVLQASCAGNGELADIFIINTCTVTGKSDQQSRNLINKARRLNPEAVVIVTGCYAEMSPEEVRRKTGADHIVSNRNKNQIVNLLNTICSRAPVVSMSPPRVMPIQNSRFRTRANLKVQDGCDNSCTYCIIRLARGPSRSVPIDEVIEQAVFFEAGGVREVILTGINLSDYGRGSSHSLVSLIEAVIRKTGLRVRLSSVHPDRVDNELVSIMFEHEQVCRHFHLSIQSLCDNVLGSMNRQYQSKTVIDVINKIHNTIPGVSIGGDIIAGFPAESETDFKETLKWVRALPLAYLHIFPYSPRKGTVAADMPPLRPEISKERAALLRAVVAEKKKQFMTSQVGKEVSVIFEKAESHYITGTSDNYLKVLHELDEPAKLLNKLVKVTPIAVSGNLLKTS